MMNFRLLLTVLVLTWVNCVGLLSAQELSTDFELLAVNWLSRPAHTPVDLWALPRTIRGQDEEPLVSDRPDFTEASSTVGLHRLQIESGYTYIRDKTVDVRNDQHVLPEALLRYGFAEGSEFRLAWRGYTFAREEGRATSAITDYDGGSDLEVGLKIELGKQCGWRPEMAVITAVTAPTGAPAFSSDQVDAIVKLLYSWEITEWLSFGSSTVHLATAELSDRHSQVAQSLSGSWKWTEQLGSYFEWFAFFPYNSDNNQPEHYLNGGFTYLFTPNFQVDWRAGFGLTEVSDNFFTGAGFVFRR
jgi:hypothetical protein